MGPTGVKDGKKFNAPFRYLDAVLMKKEMLSALDCIGL
jgi:hypothetical protein